MSRFMIFFSHCFKVSQNVLNWVFCWIIIKQRWYLVLIASYWQSLTHRLEIVVLWMRRRLESQKKETSSALPKRQDSHLDFLSLATQKNIESTGISGISALCIFFKKDDPHRLLKLQIRTNFKSKPHESKIYFFIDFKYSFLIYYRETLWLPPLYRRFFEAHSSRRIKLESFAWSNMML